MKGWNLTINKQRGFTIVELLIVIVVIAILASVVIVGYGAVTDNAKNTAFKSELTRIGEEIKIGTVDKGILDGGATSALGGDSTRLTGVAVSPKREDFDLTTPNLFYCAGTVNGVKEYSLTGKSSHGKIFYVRSNQVATELPSSTSMNYSSICPATGFTAPYTWAYGYNPSPQYGWFPWANSKAPTIKNIALNPQGVGSTSNFFVPWPGAVTATPNVSWNGKTNWYRYVWNGANYNTNRLTLNLSDLSNSSSYTVSMLVGNDGAAVRTFTMDFCDQGQTNFTLQPGESKRVSITASRSTYDNTYRFVDFNPLEANGSGILLGEVMITEGTTQHAFRDGTSVGWSWSGTANASTSTGPSP